LSRRFADFTSDCNQLSRDLSSRSTCQCH